MMKHEPQFEDYIGKRFCKLTVLELLDREYDDETGLIKKVEGGNYPQLVKYLCQCDCGNTTITARNSLRDGITKSCGCLKRGRPLGRKNCNFNIPLEGVGCKMKNPPCRKMTRMCCWDCDDYETCDKACTNSPAKCGRYKG